LKLHQDTNAFRVLLEQIHERTGYRTDVLEKDYVLRAENRIEYDTAMTALNEIHEKLLQNKAWLMFEP